MAQTNLVTNGAFQISGSNPQSFQFGTYGGYNSVTAIGESLAGWTSTGMALVYIPTDNSAVYNTSGATTTLASPLTGSANGFTNASPTGGNFVATDSTFANAAVSQTISGLTVGVSYAVSFAWAGTQETGYTGSSVERWQVTFGSGVQTTNAVTVPTQGFSGWMNQTFYYIATSTSQVLSFLSVGTPAVPPFTLLANVSVKVPEPGSVVILLTGLAGLLGLAMQRRAARGSALQGAATTGMIT